MDAGLAGGIAGVLLLLALAALCLLIRMVRKWRDRSDPAERSSVALGKHPNVVRDGPLMKARVCQTSSVLKSTCTEFGLG